MTIPATPASPSRPLPPELQTPLLVKQDGFTWPEDLPVFYLLARDGLFRCRNHPFFRSCVPVQEGPGELLPQGPALLPRYPRIPQPVFERIVGYFSRVADLHGSEAAVFLAWNRETEEVELVIPDQDATVSRGYYGGVYPVGLHYRTPTGLPSELTLFGDAHSHVKMAAYASGTDIHDEVHRPGLHLVVGHIDLEPPSFHVEAVVDGMRFRMDWRDVTEGYEARDEDVPAWWLDKVTVIEPPPYTSRSSDGVGASHAGEGRSGDGYAADGHGSGR